MRTALALSLLLIQSIQPQPAESSLEQHHAAARTALSRKDYNTAIREWTAIVRLSPGMAEAHSNLGMMYYFARKPEMAVGPFRKAAELSPTLVAPHLFLGICYYLISRPADAVAELRRTLDLQPQNGEARKWLGLSFLFNGQLPEAISTLEEARREQPKDAEITFQLARAYGRLTIESLRTIRETWPDSAWDHIVRADQYKVQGRAEDELKHRNEARRLDPEAVRVAEGLKPPTNSVRLNIAQPASARDFYTVATAGRALAAANIETFATTEPQSYRLGLLRAEFEEARENLGGAETQYRAVLRDKPDALNVHLALGRLYADRKQYQEAIGEFNAELRIDPYSTAALTQMGRAYRYLRENERAIEVLKRSLAINASSASANKEIGIAYLQAGDANLAIEHLKRADTLTSGADDSVWFQLSRAYRMAGNTLQAQKYQTLYSERLQKKNDRAP